ncbi:hypothetical protein LCGC14_2017900 [marine sediment metagenome]|uniref:Uncharacterized protein n=1 Tax=marine sediment metagenome TaxID=412755 RepID=A0A0F9HBP8_9ZZZZ
MTLNGKQPLITVSVKLNLLDAKRLGIMDSDMVKDEGKIQSQIQTLLKSIHPNVTIVDVSKSAALASSFYCAPAPSSEIEACFLAYEK